MQGPFTIGGYENRCKYMLGFMETEPAKKKIFVCYNLPLYLGYFKHFFQRFESQIYGFVDLEWCLGVETPDHLIPWLQMVNVKVRVPSEPEESDTMSQGLHSMHLKMFLKYSKVINIITDILFKRRTNLIKLLVSFRLGL